MTGLRARRALAWAPLLLAACVLTPVLLRPTGSGSAAAGDTTGADLVETLLRGLSDREQQTGPIEGELVVRSYYAPLHWDRLIGEEAEWKDARAHGRAGDRDLVTARFRLGRRNQLYEVQAGLWAGGNTWFPLDFARPAQTADDLYTMVWGDGTQMCRYARSDRGRATATVAGDTNPTPPSLRGAFAESLGLSRDGKPLSVFLRTILQRGGRVQSCERTGEGGQERYGLVLVAENPYTWEQVEIDIAPPLGFAPVRQLRTSVSREKAQLGQRTIWEWADFRGTPAGPQLPWRFTETMYFYRPQQAGGGAWEYRREYEYAHLTTTAEPSLALSEWRFPLSTHLVIDSGPSGDSLPPDQLEASRGHLLEARGYVPDLLDRPMPTPDPALNQPYTGKEGQEMEARYQEAAAWPRHD